MKLIPGLTAMLLISGCGPYHKQSFAPDHKIRSDFMNKTVQVTFDVAPDCRYFSVLWLYLSKNCSEPYALEVEFMSKRPQAESNVVVFNSLKVLQEKRDVELLGAGARTVMLQPRSDGTFRGRWSLDIGKSIVGNRTEAFKVALSYKFADKDEFTVVEKEFDKVEKRGFIWPFNKYEDEHPHPPGLKGEGAAIFGPVRSGSF
jgi:hypothetical protein